MNDKRMSLRKAKEDTQEFLNNLFPNFSGALLAFIAAFTALSPSPFVPSHSTYAKSEKIEYL